MAIVVAATITGACSVVGVWLTVRRPMKSEHDANTRRLDVVIGTLNQLVGQAETTEQKIDDHIAEHARGEFDPTPTPET